MLQANARAEVRNIRFQKDEAMLRGQLQEAQTALEETEDEVAELKVELEAAEQHFEKQMAAAKRHFEKQMEAAKQHFEKQLEATEKQFEKRSGATEKQLAASMEQLEAASAWGNKWRTKCMARDQFMDQADGSNPPTRKRRKNNDTKME